MFIEEEISRRSLHNELLYQPYSYWLKLLLCLLILPSVPILRINYYLTPQSTMKLSAINKRLSSLDCYHNKLRAQ